MKIRIEILCIIVSAFLFSWQTTASAQVNSWTNATSANWEDPYWSLGALPGTNQDIMLTNAGWKAVAIDPNTAQNFPQTMMVNSITISSPTNSYNTLLMNYAGFDTPLTAESISVGSNSAMTMLSSALELNGTNGEGLQVGGEFNQTNSLVSGQQVNVGYIGAGVYNMDSGLLDVSNLWVGGSFAGVFNQAGGTNDAGIVGIDLGVYELRGGLLASTNMSVLGEVIQTGGTNQISGPLGVGSIETDTFGGSYSLSNGLLSAVGTGVIGIFQQTGGTFTNQGDFVINYEPTFPDGAALGGTVFLSAGSFGTGSMEIYASHFIQSGGTNQVAGSITIEAYQFIGHSDYELSGGLLAASNLVILGFGDVGGLLAQTGGSFFANSLSLSIPPDHPGLDAYQDSYDLSGGNMVVSNIELSGYAAFRHQGGTLVHQGLLALAGGRWDEQTAGQQFGMLQLAYNTNTNSFLSLPPNACIIHFANSSAVPWSNAVNLILANWSGSLYGGGSQQVIFGSNSAALTPQQVSQIQFQNPAGLAPATYPARILATGEIVPDSRAPLPVKLQISGSVSNNAMPLQLQGDIGQNYEVDVSTDLVDWSPWTTESNSTGTISLSDSEVTNFPQRFYRVRLLP